MKRRDFFKSPFLFPALMLSEVGESKEVENILEYVEIKVTFPYMNTHCKNSQYIVKKTLEALSQWEDNHIMMHCHKNGNTIYDTKIDNLLCREKPKASNLNYPTIEFFSNDKKLLLPDISLLTIIKYPEVYISNKCGNVTYLGLQALNEFDIDFQEYPVEIFSIIIGGDLKYEDVNREGKLFDLRRFEKM